MGADVDNTGLKRTAHGIMLKAKEISAFGANELRWVKSSVMWGISGNFRETFIPCPSRMAPRARKGSGTGEQAAGIQERSWNVTWNQLFSKLRTYRGLGKGERHDRGFGRVGGEAPPERL